MDIFKEFTGSLDVDYETAATVISVSRRESPGARVSAMFRIAGILLWMQEITSLLPTEERAELDRWLAIRDDILRCQRLCCDEVTAVVP